MIEILFHLGLPAVVALVIAATGAVLHQYYKHRLEKERQRFEVELETLQSVHKERFDALKSIKPI